MIEQLLLLTLTTLGGAGLMATAAVLGIAAYAAHKVVRPRRDWQPDNWQPPQVPVERVSFPNRHGHRLAGWFLPPTGRHPVAILCHGFGTNRREAQDFLPWLQERGYGAILFDFQGHGESEGRVTTVGLREVDDVLAAVQFVQQRLGEDVPLVTIGFSMGAAVAIMAAARCPAVRAVIADSPFASLEQVVSRCFRQFFRLPPRLFSRPAIWFAERIAGGRVGSVVPVQAIAAIAPRPLFLIHGADDGIVDPEDGRLLYATAGEPKQFWQVEGCGHVQGRLLYPHEYARRIGDFLDRAFGVARAAA
ncbi:MAG: alpha/beta hydrolase [Chloroflexota bacterium]